MVAALAIALLVAAVPWAVGPLFGVPGSRLAARGLSAAVSALGRVVLPSATEGARFMGWFESWGVANHANRGLVVDGDRRRLSERDSFSHLVLIAPSGGGKTARYVVPNVLQLDGCSLFVTDPSGGIWRRTSGAMARRGFDVVVLDPTNPASSCRYNPLARVTGPLASMELAKALVGPPGASHGVSDASFWNSGAEQMVDALVQTLAGPKYAKARPEHANLHNVLHLLRESGTPGRRVDRFVLENGPDTAWRMWSSVVSGDAKVVANFRSTAVNALAMFGVPEVARVLSGNDVDFRAFRKRKTVLYVRVPEEKLSLYAPVLNLLYAQAFEAWKEREPGPGDLPVYVMADEFGHCAVPNFPSVATTIRKYRVSLSIVLQAKAQLVLRYGEAGAETIMGGGMGTRLVMGGGDMDTYQWCERMAGRKASVGGGRQENLINADRIRTMGDNRALLLSTNREALMLDTVPYFKNGRLMRLTEIPPVDPVSGRPPDPLAYVEV